MKKFNSRVFMLIGTAGVLLVCCGLSVRTNRDCADTVSAVLDWTTLTSGLSADIRAVWGQRMNESAVYYADRDDFAVADQMFRDSAGLYAAAIKKDAKYAGDAAIVRENYGVMMVRWADALMLAGRVEEASQTLVMAHELTPSLALPLVRLGDWANEFNRLSEAREYYEKAASARGNDSVKDYSLNQMLVMQDELDIAQKYQYRTMQTSNGDFILETPIYEGAVPPEKILSWFEEAKAGLSDRFGLETSRSLHIRIYYAVDFGRLADAPTWATAAYDCRLRLNLDKLGVREQEVENTVWHEYAHVLLEQSSRTRVPVWFQEGVAQLVEPYGKFDAREKALMSAKITTDSLQMLAEDSFADIKERENAEQAYLVSKYFVKALFDDFSSAGFRQLFSDLHTGYAFEAAFSRVFGDSPSGRYHIWLSRLKK